MWCYLILLFSTTFSRLFFPLIFILPQIIVNILLTNDTLKKTSKAWKEVGISNILIWTWFLFFFWLLPNILIVITHYPFFFSLFLWTHWSDHRLILSLHFRSPIISFNNRSDIRRCCFPSLFKLLLFEFSKHELEVLTALHALRQRLSVLNHKVQVLVS